MSNHSQMTWIHGNASHFCKDPAYFSNPIGIAVDWVIFVVGLPEVSLACYALLSLLKNNKVAPIFAINLLLSDLVQIGTTCIFIISRYFDATFSPLVWARCIGRLLVHLGLTSSLGFMLLISVERYVMVACPLWYHTQNKARLPILISLCVWTFSLAYSILDYQFQTNTRISLSIFSIFCLFPAPILLGVFVATWKALKKSLSMRHKRKDRRRVVGVLSLVLGTYTVLFFPFSIRNLYYSFKGDSEEDTVRDWSGVLTSCLVYLSPLVDPLIYIFIRRDTVESFPCCKLPLKKFKGFQHRLAVTSHTETTV